MLTLPVNATHWHLVLNHVPIFFVAIGLGVLVAGFWRNSIELKITSLVLFFLAGAVVVPVAWSGDEAEHLIEDYGGIDDQYMEQHEEAGEQTRNVVLGLGVLALAGLGYWGWTKQLPGWYYGFVGSAGLVSLYFLINTANLGGKARHIELRTGADRSPTVTQPVEENHD
jgi:hypothetical protein